MNIRTTLSWITLTLGTLALLGGAIDPLEGAFVIAPGSVLIAVASFLARTRSRRLAYIALFLILYSLAALLTLTALGGFGGNAPRLHSNWWALLLLPYPIGWLCGIVAAIWTAIALIHTRSGSNTVRPQTV